MLQFMGSQRVRHNLVNEQQPLYRQITFTKFHGMLVSLVNLVRMILKVKESESEVSQSCPTLYGPMDCRGLGVIWVNQMSGNNGSNQSGSLGGGER